MNALRLLIALVAIFVLCPNPTQAQTPVGEVVDTLQYDGRIYHIVLVKPNSLGITEENNFIDLISVVINQEMELLPYHIMDKVSVKFNKKNMLDRGVICLGTMAFSTEDGNRGLFIKTIWEAAEHSQIPYGIGYETVGVMIKGYGSGPFPQFNQIGGRDLPYQYWAFLRPKT